MRICAMGGASAGSSSVVAKWLFVITSLLEQAPDWLTRREYPPKFRFFNSLVKHPKCSIRAASFTRIAPQDCLSRLCIDLTCKSFACNASFASGVNAPEFSNQTLCSHSCHVIESSFHNRKLKQCSEGKFTLEKQMQRN